MAIWHKHGQFEAAPTIAKSLISIVIVGMGAAIGREAALKDTGATVARKISDWTSLSPEQRHLLVACGAGAGMAAAYNVPLGGALFAAEVLLGTMSLTNILAAIITSFVAVAARPQDLCTQLRGVAFPTEKPPPFGSSGLMQSKLLPRVRQIGGQLTTENHRG